MTDHDRVTRRDSQLSREAEALLTSQAQKGDLQARRTIGEAHYGFVSQLAKRYAGTSVTSQWELIQAGYMGLMECIDKFDATKGTRLLTLAFWSIRRHMLDLLKVNSAATSSYRLSMDSAVEHSRISALPLELRDSMDDGEGGTLGSCFVDESAKLATMKKRTQGIVRRRLGIGKHEKNGTSTFVEIGKHYGISAERARRIYTSSIEKIRDGLGIQEDSK